MESDSSKNGGNVQMELKLEKSYMDPQLERDVSEAWHEMMETESRGVANRVVDLERRVLEQGDELVCLKATLAEALRRINILEGSRLAHQIVTTPVQARNGGHATTPTNAPVLKRPTSYSASRTDLNRKSYAGSSLPQRRAIHYQSTGSLHSDSQSSSSVSPVPSPSPRATPQPLSKRPPLVSPSQTTTLHKRWSSTGDFNQHINMQSKFSTKSFLNLYMKPSTTSSSNIKHGTRDVSYNEDDQTLKMYLRGRPVILHAPTDIADSFDLTKVSTAPSERLKLDWAYGYRGRDCRSNLYLLPTGEMVYFVAAVVVLYNVEEQNQRHYLGHTDDVKSLAIHPNKLLVATGQCAGHDKRDARPHIRIWNSVSLHTQAIIGVNEFNVSVCCISFSKADGGSLLLAVDEAQDHMISVWDWQKGENGHKITETKCSVDTVVAAEFHPLDRNNIVTCGKNHIAFWTLDAGGTLYKRMGIFESRDKPKFVLSVAFLQSGDVITGDSNGNLAIWGRGTNTVQKFIKNVHEGGIFSICVTKDGSVITGGGKDGKLVQFDPNLSKNREEITIEKHFGGVRVVSEGRGSQLLLGTTRNCILVGTVGLAFQPIVLGHADELWALAAHPSVPQFATAGQDKLLQMWDSMSHSILWSKDIGEQAHSIAFSSDGCVVVVGCLDGQWLVFDTQSREFLGKYKDGDEPIQTITFSPDGNLLAVGSRDNNIYIYQVSEQYRFSRIGKCLGHSSFITHIDWAEDNQSLRSNSGDYELLYWNATTCRQIVQSSTMKDIKWATNTCTLSFGTVGIWPENADGTDVNACCTNSVDTLMATGDDFGKIKLYSYPVSQPKSLNHVYGGHSSHVTNVTFIHDDSRLVSVGGKDTSVLQWTVS
ncbi:PREDICTED: echinoderm microtubule-associated protein-like 2 isoform X2 [Nicrophorus vespilloides]|nr:PREDICTED: echinoderm microtubule-associated protein-like 2 isoform X2 [Nicrophorus vespilloides]